MFLKCWRSRVPTFKSELKMELGETEWREPPTRYILENYKLPIDNLFYFFLNFYYFDLRFAPMTLTQTWLHVVCGLSKLISMITSGTGFCIQGNSTPIFAVEIAQLVKKSLNWTRVGHGIFWKGQKSWNRVTFREDHIPLRPAISLLLGRQTSKWSFSGCSLPWKWL